ncbi:ImmA/IrrE family metallo-endopeptidase [Mycolicibacterium mucogenicum]|uniref:ImmA/IrrE family metallo-endopeptidase n=1 Tax=Mycolicibacterium mucogenicum TaxID=56689 RepID=UPI002269A904|nr:ImmA/IrrE family metallo-endopeptidase [Mycolicibacterium mucogenicum]MCX8559828.1 ImmA/IrrE family metallo-endopeptidase [Mycolicibacterium mucogenicum]
MALVVDAARDAAITVKNDYGVPGRFPVDVESIAMAMGIRVEYTYLRDGVSGMIEARPGVVPVIYVDKTEAPARQRFTIAHELGHYVERSNQGVLDFAFIDERGTKYDLHEFYADEFAGNLLMPAEEVRYLRSRGESNVAMAAYFGVSVPALIKRVDRLARIESA